MRARNIKPGFFQNEQLAELPFEARLLFEGLWLLADRAGRLEDRPKRIKAQIFPYDNLDAEPILEALEGQGLIVRYEASGIKCVEIPTFGEHQRPHANEKPSELPPRPDALATKVESSCDQGDKHFALNPSSLNPESQNSCSSRDERFAEFWKIYPRKVGKDKALSAWKAKQLDLKADEIIAHLQRRIREDRQWLEDRKYIPFPATWLNRGGWQDEYDVEVEKERRAVF